MKRRFWTEAEIELLVKRYPHERSDAIARDLGRPLHQIYGKADALGLKKTAAYLSSPDACRLRRDNHPGTAYQYQKGHVPANKGIKGWQSGGRSAETRFKKGQKPGNWLPIGSHRFSKEGYLQRKLTDTGYPPRDWVPVHHILWREAGREIPQGFRLTFKDGNKQNIVIGNLELVSIADMMRRNTFHNYGKDIAQLVHLRAVISRKINREAKNV